jgi:hypothetical protein
MHRLNVEEMASRKRIRDTEELSVWNIIQEEQKAMKKIKELDSKRVEELTSKVNTLDNRMREGL